MAAIKRENYDLYEQMILSDQMHAKEVMELLHAEPEFASWLNRRRVATVSCNE